ncbi:calycin-like domain-containing protein [Xylanibacter muris]|uniref:Lipocalin-like domain-containing protein n=1 Tax=Xylanibacter muris TaxID=2736290 RepID=A0ABX2AJ17_9BACT|nr:calycin-like domain-containing protein [Xylanibacter muris]NPD90954.1 hypothetical protein [Xylanibacter muris]
MKTIKVIFATMFVVVSAVAFASCSGDDDDSGAVVTPVAGAVAGVYYGNMTCSVMGGESVFEGVTFTVEDTGDATVDIKVSSFGTPPMQVPGITIPGVMVSGADGTYILAPTEFSGTTDTGKAYSGIVQGNYADNVITVRFNLNYGTMPMPMICTFTASRH